jgi:predicted MFS family arabinose efflux permease
MKKPSVQISLGIAFGTALGAAVALLIGSGGLWLAGGVAIGVAIGAAIPRKSNHQHQKLETRS